MKRIGMLTSGGDCQGLNSTLRGVAKALYEEYGKEVEIYGFKDGYKGLIQGEYRLMSPSDFSGILTIGGTILGTSRQPFKNMRDKDENGVDKVTKMIQTYNDMKLDCLVILGGNGTTKTANLLREEGLNIISLCRRPLIMICGAQRLRLAIRLPWILQRMFWIKCIPPQRHTAVYSS